MVKKCLAIGVSTVDPIEGQPDKFPYLDGAVVAAQTMGRWALNSGFDATNVKILVDSGDERVTVQSVENAIRDLLPPGEVTEHFILSFAGHGLTGLNDDITYWLLNDSLQNGYQIFVEDMRRELYSYGIKHLSIFSDACREVASYPELRNLNARTGVARRNSPPNIDIKIDRYNACQDTTSAFMVKAAGSAAPGKCIFSGVVADALWGFEERAFEKGVINSGSLGRFLEEAAQERAATYNLVLKPGGSIAFRPAVYVDMAKLPNPPDPKLVPWPAVALPVAAAPIKAVTPTVFHSVLNNQVSRKKVLGKTFGEAFSAFDVGKFFPGFPASARDLVEDLAASRKLIKSEDLDHKARKKVQVSIDRNVRNLEAIAAKKAKTKGVSEIRSAFRRINPEKLGSHTNLVVANGKIAQIWSEVPLGLSGRGRTRKEFEVSMHSLERSATGTQLMIEFDDHTFAPVWIYPDLRVTVIRDTVGVSGLAYSSRREPSVRYAESYRKSIDTVASMASGKISVNQIESLAIDLRRDKHINPAFGAIAAYCYDVVGDLDSIRRMAYFYCENNQRIPYDIVFMGMIPTKNDVAHVQKVSRQRVMDGRLPLWVTMSTPSAKGLIAGRCPWLRQGWDFMSAPEDVEKPLIGNLAGLREKLKHSNFTSFDRKGGMALIQEWGLQPGL